MCDNRFMAPILTAVFLLLCSCATQRINQFKLFSDAGESYTTALSELLKEAGNIAVDADSENLIRNRESFGSEKRSEVYSQHREALNEYFSVLDDFRTHTNLLNNYFSVLAGLAGSKSGENVGQLTGNIVKKLQQIHPQLAKARIGDAQVGDFLEAAIPVVISQMKKEALESELRMNGQMIERELELQRAVITALSEGIRSDLEVIAGYNEMTLVAEPFISDGKLPAGWKKERKQLMTTAMAVASLEKAVSAAGELKQSFLALVENKSGPVDYNILISDINSMIDFIELIRNNPHN